MAKRKGESFVLDFSGDELKAQTFEEVVKERDAIAAALREAREDTKRLDWLLTVPGVQLYSISRSEEFFATSRTEIDAAMKPPGGEGE